MLVLWSAIAIYPVSDVLMGMDAELSPRTRWAGDVHALQGFGDGSPRVRRRTQPSKWDLTQVGPSLVRDQGVHDR